MLKNIYASSFFILKPTLKAVGNKEMSNEQGGKKKKNI